jgi:8-oxo-dGTP pyrophosphatase MutT (NUDIX family)
MTTLNDIALILARHKPEILEAPTFTRAAVALILCEGEKSLEALFIERASRDNDPWSGDIALPGGRVEKEDGNPRQTAERETLEEIGLDLGKCSYLGRLSDIVGAHLPVLVTCFVYGAAKNPLFVINHEVRDIFRVSISDLNAPDRHITSPVRFGGETFVRPAIRLPQSGKPPLWGLTYRFIMEFLGILAESGDNGFRPQTVT